MWIALAFGSAVFAGLTAILAAAGLKKIDSYVATALRTIVVLVFAWMMVFVAGSQGTLFSLTPETWLFLCLSGLTTGGSWLCYFRALQLGDVNKVVPVDKSSVLLTMVLAFCFLGEPIGWLTLAAMALIAVGTLLMIRKKPSEGEKTNVPHHRAWLLYAVLSAVFASLTSILGKLGMANVESNLGTAIRTVVVLLMAWLMVWVLKKPCRFSEIDRKSWAFLAASGVTTGLSWLCYYRALQEGPASVVVPIDKLSIVVTAVLAWVLLKEKLTPASLTGLVLIIGGTLLLLV